MLKLTIWRALIILVIVCGVPFKSFASGCAITNGGYYINVGTVVVPQGIVDNSYVSGKILAPAAIAWKNCTGLSTQYTEFHLFAATAVEGVIGSYHVFDTNLDGIGIALGGSGSFNGPSGCTFGYDNYIPSTTTTVDLCRYGSGLNNQEIWAQPYLRLVKYGQITAGALTGKIGSIEDAAHDPRLPPIPVYITGNISYGQCTTTTTSLSFPLGDVPAADFSNHPGFILEQHQYQNVINFNCDPGANITATLMGDQNPDVSDTSVLALTGQGGNGVAQGVGVQIVSQGLTLALNQPILLKQSAGTLEPLTITARYYQTRAAVSVGSANSSATLVFTYQ